MEKRQLIKDYAIRYAVITLGCLFYSFGVSLFLDAGGLSSGGVTGIAIIINHLLRFNNIDFIDTGIIIVIINIPLLIVGTLHFGKKFLFSTVYTTLLSSLLMVFWKWLFNQVYHLPITDNMLISAVFGGALFGVGAGLIFRMGGSTGGTDIPVKILRKKFRHIKTGMISMTSDIIVVALSFLVFQALGEGDGLDVLFYTIVSVVVFTIVFDWVLYGGNSAKMVYIITSPDKKEVLRERILNDVDTGATLVDAEGAYSKQQKAILLCVVKPFLYPKLRDVVHEEDNEAFIIVSSAKEIYGKGYQNPDDDVI
jgi:uncharacterized membrane-anchored protein YitT (DUF2179 family)